MLGRYRSIFSAASLFLSCGLAAASEDVAAGGNEFRIACAACHGQDAKGNGEVAPLLVVKPANLTLLSKKNDGKFPFLRVFQTIDGRATVKSHGASAMPLWGDRYTIQSGAGGVEPYKSWTSEPFVRARILELTYYIQSIQE